MKKAPKTKFLKVRCPKCKNEQLIFERASKSVSCLVCNEIIATPKGGKAKINASILESLE